MPANTPSCLASSQFLPPGACAAPIDPLVPPSAESVWREATGTPPPLSTLVLEPAPDPAEVEGHLTRLQCQLDTLGREIDQLRHRDETLTRALNELSEEQRLAARLQRDFLPKTMPRVGSIEFQALFRPAGFVSGDLYDVMRLDETNVAFYLADAVGHGVPAALLTMFMKNALRTKTIASDGAYTLVPPAQSVGYLNQSLVDANLSNGTFATAVYGRIDTRSLEMTYAGAGHPNPVLLRDGQMIDLPCDGPLLGIFDNEPFHDCRVQLRPGDKVFIYTDGLELQLTDAGRTDPTLWRRVLAAHADASAPALLRTFTRLLDTDHAAVKPKDDVTVLVVDVR